MRDRLCVQLIIITNFIWGIIANAADIGFVSNATSNSWQLISGTSGSRVTVQEGISVQGGDQLVAIESKRRNANIAIVLYKGEDLGCRRNPSETKCSCPPIIETCAIPLQFPESLSEKSNAIIRTWEAIKRQLQGHPERYATTISRGFPVPPDSVIAFQPQNPSSQLSALFLHLQPATYMVYIRSLSQDRPPGKAYSVTWNGKRIIMDSNAISAPGIFEIRFVDPNGTTKGPLAASTWVLAVKSNQYEQANTEYNKMKRITDAWESVSTKGRYTILRAYLEVLANQFN